MEKNREQKESFVQDRIKQEDKKAFKKLSVIMVGAFLFGMLLSFLLIFIKESGNVKELGDALVSNVVFISPYLMVAFFLVMAVVICYLYVSSKREYKTITEDDEKIEKIERKLQWGGQLAEISLIVTMCLFGLTFYMLTFSTFKAGSFVIILVIYMLSIVVFTFESKCVVNQLKRINPEKKGSTFDLKFDKIWLDSCDEAEKLNTYEAGYKAYCLSNKLCIVLCTLFLAIGMFFPIGILPLITVVVIRVVESVTYTYHITKKR